MTISIVWLRRDLRIQDHTAFASAISSMGEILPIFIFDKEILSRFNNKNDSRITFISNAIHSINEELKKYNSQILILHGYAKEILPNLAKNIGATKVFASLDHEPETRNRDNYIKSILENDGIEFNLEEDTTIISVNSITKKDKSPYKVYSPYRRVWIDKIIPTDYMERIVNLVNAKFCKIEIIKNKLLDSDIRIIESDNSKSIIEQIGYNHVNIPKYFNISGQNKLKSFIKNRLQNYEVDRNYMSIDGTSGLSPYIRFGLISIRECYRMALRNANIGDSWINELIWRDFYKMILYHFPKSASTEFKSQFNDINWENDEKKLEAWKNGKTGYPLIDAAMRQLTTIGWMHNRLRMITASFLSKHLLIDWRMGEEHFAQYLLDYDLSSNVGGWQWSASTGNDPIPYFRIFNPTEQAKKYDSKCIFIKKYVKELRNIDPKEILSPKKNNKKLKKPIIDHEFARKRAISIYKEARIRNETN